MAESGAELTARSFGRPQLIIEPRTCWVGIQTFSVSQIAMMISRVIPAGIPTTQAADVNSCQPSDFSEAAVELVPSAVVWLGRSQETTVSGCQFGIASWNHGHV